jgi:Holliday junction resolvase RusA-like endonuclease
MLQITIPYAAKPQGSKKAFLVNGRPVLVEASKGLKERRAEFIAYIHGNLGDWSTPDQDEPVRVFIEFQFERPKSSKRRYMTTTPDIDKAARFILDVLTQSGVIHDDKQITELALYKTYGEHNATYIELDHA